MDTNPLSRCEPIVLKPAKINVPQIPPYPEAKETEEPLRLDATNDPDDVRCSLVSLFGGELLTGLWKHYLTADELDTAPRHYRKILQNADWHVSLENFTGDLQYAYAWHEEDNTQQNLLVFFYREPQTTHVVTGCRRE